MKIYEHINEAGEFLKRIRGTCFLYNPYAIFIEPHDGFTTRICDYDREHPIFDIQHLIPLKGDGYITGHLYLFRWIKENVL